MKQPTKEEISEVENLITSSIKKLIEFDSDIFNIELPYMPFLSEDARVLNRELHETAINHRFAFYLEEFIRSSTLPPYNVDIEYNRNYGDLKRVETIEGLLSIRPDILIHSRMNREIKPQHYLAIEAKKGEVSEHDKNKIKGLISDGIYFYVFGLTISYCLDEQHVIGTLYYFDGKSVDARIEIKLPK